MHENQFPTRKPKELQKEGKKKMKFNPIKFEIMPNWCSTAYAIEGDAKEIKSLYKLMKGLQERKEPSVENGFGTTWLGCLVDALGKDWHTVHCRGSWSCLELEDDVLKFFTETAWSPCNETFELVREKYPFSEYFEKQEDVFQWLEEKSGMSVKSVSDIDALDTQWRDKDDDAFCSLHEFEVVN